jgi:hypothetical protein
MDKDTSKALVFLAFDLIGAGGCILLLGGLNIYSLIGCVVVIVCCSVAIYHV